MPESRKNKINWYPIPLVEDDVDLSPDVKLPIDGEELNDDKVSEITGDWLGSTHGKILRFLIKVAVLAGLVWAGIALWHIGLWVFISGLVVVLLIMGIILFGPRIRESYFDEDDRR